MLIRSATLLSCWILLSSGATATVTVTITAVTQDGENDLDVSDGGKLFNDGPDSSFVSATKTENGHSLDYLLTEGERFTPGVHAMISSDTWFVIEFEETPRLGSGRVAVFDPYGSVVSDWLFGKHAFRPSPGFSYEFILGYQRTNCNGMPDRDICRVVPTSFEYTVTEIADPIPGDVNLDGRVAFDDFLVLSTTYADNFFAPRGGWFAADFDLNSNVDMRDFQALKSNFGRTAAGFNGDVKTVPEPGFHLMFFTAAILLSALRRSRPITTTSR